MEHWEHCAKIKENKFLNLFSKLSTVYKKKKNKEEGAVKELDMTPEMFLFWKG